MQALQPVIWCSAAQTAGESLQESKAAPYRISFDRQSVDQGKERRRLTKEQEVIREGLDGGDGSSVLGQCWPNHGAGRQTLIDKFAGLRQDQVGLVEF